MARRPEGGDREPLVISGAWDVPPLWFGLLFLFAGLIAMHKGMTYHDPDRELGSAVARMMIFSTGALFSLLGAWMLRLRRLMRRMATLDQLRPRLRFSKAILEHVALDRGIRPRVISNGVKYYDLTDFGDPAMLLRPAVPPETPENSLLRPARGEDSTADRLLLPAEREEELRVEDRTQPV